MIATPAGQPWRFRAPLILAVLGLFLLLIALLLVAISEANLTF
jgi:hypothetical protein